MKIAVASGKGGTGKTTVAVNIARVAGADVHILDCDVEEPNAHLFLKGTSSGMSVVSIPVPEVDAKLCNACGACSRLCRYNAIVTIGSSAMVFPDMCHGCGGCVRVCPQKAIAEHEQRIGTIETIVNKSITVFKGSLDVGMSLAPPVIRAVKSKGISDTVIIDAPPGTSCPVIAAIRDTDLVILVTEPTPFGLNDLTLAVAMVREIGIPFGVVVNRFGIGDDRVHAYCRTEGIALIAEIPDDRRIAECYSRGELIVEALPEFRTMFRALYDNARGLYAGVRNS